MIIVRADKAMRDLLSEFGFCGYNSLYVSLFRIGNGGVISIFAGLGAIAENLVGLSSHSLLILLIMLLVELIIGIASGLKRTGRFRVRSLQRFGLKVFIYFLLLLVLHTFKMQYTGGPEFYVYSSLHSFVVFYITGVYLISILENTAYLLGGSKEINGLLKIFRVKMKKVTDAIEGEDTKLSK